MLQFPVPEYIDRTGEPMTNGEEEYIKSEYFRCGYSSIADKHIAKSVGRSVREVLKVIGC